jgi:hypothetical protein
MIGMKLEKKSTKNKKKTKIAENQKDKDHII